MNILEAKRRGELVADLLRATDGLSREAAFTCIFSWLALDDLEWLAPAVRGPDAPPPQEVAQQAFLQRLSTAADARGVKVAATHPSAPRPEAVRLFIEALWEAR